MTDFIAWWTAERLMTVATVVAGIAAVFAWNTAIGANRRAKKANEIAEDSNTLAEKALSKAEIANSIAEDANQISSNANAISQRALAVTEDNLIYDWGFEIDRDKWLPFFANNSTHAAHNVSITVRTKFRQVAESFHEEVPRFTKFYFDTECIMEELAEDAKAIARINRGGGIMYLGSPSCSTSIYINWETESGVKRSDVIQHKFSN